MIIPADLEVVPEAMLFCSNKHTDDLSFDFDVAAASLLANDAPIIPPPMTKCLHTFSIDKANFFNSPEEHISFVYN